MTTAGNSVPIFTTPDRPPGLRAALRAVRTVVDGWPAQVFAGKSWRARYPGSALIVADPHVAGQILGNTDDAFPHGPLFDRLFRPVWGRGIFVAEGADWRWQRRAASPAFRPAQMQALAPIVARAAQDAIAGWPVGEPIELHQAMRRLTLAILFETALSGGADFPDKAIAADHVRAFLDGVGQFALRDFVPLPALLRGSTRGRGARHAAYLRTHVDAMIARRRREGGGAKDLVAMLMAATDPETGRAMDDVLLRDNLIGFLAAGTDTSSNALAWALWLLAGHPDVAARLRAEVEGVAGDAPIGAGDVERLVYTRQVVRETQRLYPGALSLVRTAARDCTIGGVAVREGTLIQIATYALHHRADLWRDPGRFDPDRFAPDAPPPPRGAYLPFGAGPRICIGAAFAMVEMTVALATIVRAVDLTPDPARPMRLGVRLGAPVAAEGMWMRARALT